MEENSKETCMEEEGNETCIEDEGNGLLGLQNLKKHPGEKAMEGVVQKEEQRD